jgi:Cu-processing system ATP-binding protein
MKSLHAETAMSAISLRGVSHQFGAFTALQDVSFDIGRGEMFGLIGHNGAGKSTLFKLMLGLLTPASGSIKVLGQDTGAAAFRQTRRQIGYLPENFVTYDNLSGAEVLQLFADLKQVPRSTCADLLDLVGLTAAAGRHVQTYSKGMRQRLGLAQALLGEPQLIFLDEPTNGLDPQGIADFYAILDSVRARRHHSYHFAHPGRDTGARRSSANHARWPRGRTRHAGRTAAGHGLAADGGG